MRTANFTRKPKLPTKGQTQARTHIIENTREVLKATAPGARHVADKEVLALAAERLSRFFGFWRLFDAERGIFVVPYEKCDDGGARLFLNAAPFKVSQAIAAGLP